MIIEAPFKPSKDLGLDIEYVTVYKSVQKYYSIKLKDGTLQDVPDGRHFCMTKQKGYESKVILSKNPYTLHWQDSGVLINLVWSLQQYFLIKMFNEGSEEGC
jgi:hypothetical protein